LVCPHWGINTLKHGIPNFATLKPYMEKGLDLRQLGQFMNRTFTGKVNIEKVKAIRDLWPGALVVKGIASTEDMDAVVSIGVDGVIVSNHGGRQIDAGESSLHSLIRLTQQGQYRNKVKIMLDGGIRSGGDLARAHAVGSDFNFMGRPFMYGLGALGDRGGDHTINMFKAQLHKVMPQLRVESVEQMQERLIKTVFFKLSFRRRLFVMRTFRHAIWQLLKNPFLWPLFPFCGGRYLLLSEAPYHSCTLLVGLPQPLHLLLAPRKFSPHL